MAFDTATVSGHSGGTGRQLGEITATTSSGGGGGGSSLFSFLGGGSGGFLDDALGFFKKNPKAVSAIFSGVGDFIEGEQARETSTARRDAYLHSAATLEATAALIQSSISDEVFISNKERQAKLRKDWREIRRLVPATANRGVLIGGGSARDIVLAGMINSVSDQGDMRVNEKRRILGLEVEEFNVLSQADIFRSAANEVNPDADALITAIGATSKSIFDILARQNRRVTTA